MTVSERNFAGPLGPRIERHVRVGEAGYLSVHVLNGTRYKDFGDRWVTDSGQVVFKPANQAKVCPELPHNRPDRLRQIQDKLFCPECGRFVGRIVDRGSKVAKPAKPAGPAEPAETLHGIQFQDF